MSNLIFFPFVVLDLAHNDLENSNFALESKTFNLDKTNTINKVVHVMCVPQQSYPQLKQQHNTCLRMVSTEQMGTRDGCYVAFSIVLVFYVVCYTEETNTTDMKYDTSSYRTKDIKTHSTGNETCNTIFFHSHVYKMCCKNW